MSGRHTNIAFSPSAAGPAAGGDIIVSLVHDGFDIGADENAGQGSWQDRALCAQTDPEAFFPEKGGSTREAKRVCRGCEVRAECLEYALEHDERFGIWGGLSERERRRLKREPIPGLDQIGAGDRDEAGRFAPPRAPAVPAAASDTGGTPGDAA
jgi:WhiB family redox-sensing transcriptional regulator